jgi:hypothetical protein
MTINPVILPIYRSSMTELPVIDIFQAGGARMA